MTKRSYVTGLYQQDEAAAAAVTNLLEAGFAAAEIAVLQTDGGAIEPVELEHNTGVGTGAAVGGAAGGALGAVGVGLVSVGAVAAPGIGLLAAGPILAALQGAVAGAAGGGLFGTLAGLAFWKKEIDPETLKDGLVFVGVPAAAERRPAAVTALADAGAVAVESGE